MNYFEPPSTLITSRPDLSGTMDSEPVGLTNKLGSPAIDAVEDVLYGSIAGSVGKLFEYPFDTVKVRLQSQADHLPLRYKGPIDCFGQAIRQDGFLSLYRGISAPLVGAALETSSLFLWEQAAQKALWSSGLYSQEKPLPLSALYVTGAIAGAFTSLILTPIELIKCKMQVPVIATTDGMVSAAPKPMAIIRQVFRYQGIMGFWNGQLGTLIRETGGGAAWFGSKETVTMLFRRWNRSKRARDGTLSTVSDTAPLPYWQQAVAGATAGMSYNFLFFPADTIKSRMQTSSIDTLGSPKMTFWKEGVSIYQRYGVRGLYRGCGVTVLRSAPSSAFIFMVYDGLKSNFRLS